MADALRKSANLYDRDAYAWTQDQAAKLRTRAGFENRGDIDWDDAAEEIERVGSSERNEIENRLGILIAHLLAWRYQPDRRSDSWQATLAEQRFRIARRIRRSPSLTAFPARIVADDYPLARLSALGETDLPADRFPTQCPFMIEQILDLEFHPDEQ